MRLVFVGAGPLTVATARLLIHRGHDLVIVEQDQAVIDALQDALDCGFLHGDGSKPAILREADPEGADMLLCLTGNDQTNIIASLVGRSLGFPRVVTKIEDREFEHICVELGLEDTIVPDGTIARYLADMAEGLDILELSAMLKHGARVLSFIVHEPQQGRIDELNLPDQTRVICLYRNERLLLADPDTRLKTGDEVLILTHRDHAQTLLETWQYAE
jgi:trk system potassium uptake protein TrkA